IEVLDDVIDFDDFVDTATLSRLNCGGNTPYELAPSYYQTGDPADDIIFPAGVLSGIVLLPEKAHDVCTFIRFGPDFFPIHNEDGLNDYPDTSLPRDPQADPTFQPQISWNIFFHDLAMGINTPSCSGTIPSEDFQTAYAAHQYLHTWEGFPDLYDYDVFAPPGPVINCPVGAWDIMASGGLVHPVPILKEKPCTEWITPVDLKTVVTPGVDTVLTLPLAEFVRDGSYYFLENESRLGERYYFWSAGSGFDERMPGEGLLILHVDVGSDPDALPPQQRSGTRPTYLIVQGDGLGELQAGTDCGDDGDPWPGITGATRFNFNTTPAATWYTQNSWIGLDILNVVRDDVSGSVQLTLNWVPTTIPALRFINPPGGQSVGSIYQVRFEATDVYGGTTIHLYYMGDEGVCSNSSTLCADDTDCPTDEFCRYETVIDQAGANFIGQLRKVTPGTNQLGMDWEISSIPDGRYVLFAKLIPGPGADGMEDSATTPRAGRNNVGNGSLVVDNVNIKGNTARLETWTAICLDADSQRWRVNSSLSQPVINKQDPNADPYPRAVTGQPYSSVGGEVTFTIIQGSEPSALGDTFVFATTGITAVSRSVTVVGGQVRADPVAVIAAAPLAGHAPLRVTFDGRDSYDPFGEALVFLWNFGDGSRTASGARIEHVFQNPGTFTTVLRVTNPMSGRFGEASVDIEVFNNSPNAVVTAVPTSGPAPLPVRFDASGSWDLETPASQLVYQWDFGDGTTANDNGVPGILIQTEHIFSERLDGTLCTDENPCTFVAALTVTDSGGLRDTALTEIAVGGVGACCFPDDICFDSVASNDCRLIRGSFLGNGLACNSDPDGDGAIGCDDGCPLDGGKVDPGVCGCGVLDRDSDGDGVPDCVDLCPGNPPDMPVDERGCPLLGACCFLVGVCIDNTLPNDCFAVGGAHQGTGAPCDLGCRFPGDGDFDGDKDVDLDDFVFWAQCAAGPYDDSYPEACEPLDFNWDGDVDMADFARFQVAFSSVLCQTDADCDDGLFCNGAEVCNMQGGCDSPGNPCDEGENCDEANDECRAACSTDADCDDDVWCNGLETC
ncbi:MAG: PKD domain-containing protein, partial [Phycisphaerales bacterium]